MCFLLIFIIRHFWINSTSYFLYPFYLVSNFILYLFNLISLQNSFSVEGQIRFSWMNYLNEHQVKCNKYTDSCINGLWKAGTDYLLNYTVQLLQLQAPFCVLNNSYYCDSHLMHPLSIDFFKQQKLKLFFLPLTFNSFPSVRKRWKNSVHE